MRQEIFVVFYSKELYPQQIFPTLEGITNIQIARNLEEEIIALQHIHQRSRTTDFYIFYINADLTNNFMLEICKYFLIENMRKITELLLDYDLIGINYTQMTNSFPNYQYTHYFRENWWWSRSTYIRQLHNPQIYKDNLYLWIGSGKGLLYSIYQHPSKSKIFMQDWSRSRLVHLTLPNSRKYPLLPSKKLITPHSNKIIPGITNPYKNQSLKITNIRLAILFVLEKINMWRAIIVKLLKASLILRIYNPTVYYICENDFSDAISFCNSQTWTQIQDLEYIQNNYDCVVILSTNTPIHQINNSIQLYLFNHPECLKELENGLTEFGDNCIKWKMLKKFANDNVLSL